MAAPPQPPPALGGGQQLTPDKLRMIVGAFELERLVFRTGWLTLWSMVS